jgi:hypothetical protein
MKKNIVTLVAVTLAIGGTIIFAGCKPAAYEGPDKTPEPEPVFPTEESEKGKEPDGGGEEGGEEKK